MLLSQNSMWQNYGYFYTKQPNDLPACGPKLLKDK